MLDKAKVKKGDKVYKVEWIDLPDLRDPFPRVRAYLVVEWGNEFGAVKEISFRDGYSVSGKFKRNTPQMEIIFSPTPEAAIKHEMQKAKNEMESGRSKIKKGRWALSVLKKLDPKTAVQAKP